MAADTLDVIGLTDAKRAISMSTINDDHDGTLERHITTVSRILDDTVGPVVQRTITNEQHAGGRATVRLRHYPVATVTTVEEARGGAASAVTAVAFGATGNGYVAPTWTKDPSLLSGVLHRSGQPCWYPGVRAVQVTYTAGRYADTDSVDARFVDCAAAILRRLWKRESGTWSQSSDFFESLGDSGAALPGSGFYRVARPIIDDLLWDDVQTRLVGFA